jgi:hypothetical protein
MLGGRLLRPRRLRRLKGRARRANHVATLKLELIGLVAPPADTRQLVQPVLAEIIFGAVVFGRFHRSNFHFEDLTTEDTVSTGGEFFCPQITQMDTN